MDEKVACCYNNSYLRKVCASYQSDLRQTRRLFILVCGRVVSRELPGWIGVSTCSRGTVNRSSVACPACSCECCRQICQRVRSPWQLFTVKCRSCCQAVHTD